MDWRLEDAEKRPAREPGPALVGPAEPAVEPARRLLAVTALAERHVAWRRDALAEPAAAEPNAELAEPKAGDPSAGETKNQNGCEIYTWEIRSSRLSN